MLTVGFNMLLSGLSPNFQVDAFCDKDERNNVWGQKVKGQGHSMTKEASYRDGCYVSSSSFWFRPYTICCTV